MKELELQLIIETLNAINKRFGSAFVSATDKNAKKMLAKLTDKSAILISLAKEYQDMDF